MRSLLHGAALGALLLTLAGSSAGVPLARAGEDTCPEPNSELESACFLGPGAPAPGFIDTLDDVDAYKIELPSESMLVATLSSLPGDYALRLLLPDGSVHAEAGDPGRDDKVLRADGLEPGTYFLLVVSPREDSSSDQPYLLSVAYPPSVALATPLGSTGEPQFTQGYIPPPARAYALTAADIGGNFREVARDEPEDGRQFAVRHVAPDAVQVENFWVSRTNISMIDTMVYVQPYGYNDELTNIFNRLLDDLRSKGGANVQPAAGWGSEQVYSYAWGSRGVMYRGIALKHRNAVVHVEMLGFEQYATWDRLSSLTRLVEERIHAAAQ